MKLRLKTYPHWASLTVLAIGVLLRFIYLDADPYYYEWVGYITDEGRWVQHARSFSLFGSLLFDHNIYLHFYLAPFYQLITYLVFETAGVSLFTSRVLSAFCGSALLVLVWARLRRIVSPQAVLLGVTLIGLQPDLLALSRIAVPEMAAMFFQALIYFVIVMKGRSVRRFALAGFLMFMAVGIKATTALVLPIFSAVILLMPRHSDRPATWRGLMLFWGGFLLPIALFIAISIFVLPEQSADLRLHIAAFFKYSLRTFIAFSGLYGVTKFAFEDVFAATFNLWALAVWLAALAWVANEGNRLDFDLSRYFVTSFVWSILYTALMLSLEYFPTRYKVHSLIPMTLCLIVGISIVQRSGLQPIIKFFGRLDDIHAALWLPVLCLPTAIFFSPLADSAVAIFSMNPERLSSKIACLLFVFAGTVYVATRYRRNEDAIGFLLCFPLLGGAGWAMLSASTNGYSFWPSAGSPFHFVWYGVGIFALSVAAIILGQPLVRLNLAARTRLVTAGALLAMLIALPSVAPGYIDPHYSMADTSRDLGKLLSSRSRISALRTEGLFNDNHLRYSSYTRWAQGKPEALVLAFTDVKRVLILQKDYELVKSYKLLAPREDYQFRPDSLPNDGEGVVVSVYVKKDAAIE